MIYGAAAPKGLHFSDIECRLGDTVFGNDRVEAVEDLLEIGLALLPPPALKLCPYGLRVLSLGSPDDKEFSLAFHLAGLCRRNNYSELPS